MKKKELNIWKDILEKNFNTKDFPNATTIQNENGEYTIQLFELLVAETLNLHDQDIKWEVTKSGHDHGVDLVGHELNDIYLPFIPKPLSLISLGQVKRKASSYRYDDFKNDLFKINEYCKNSDFFKSSSLKQFLFVLSSNKKDSMHNIQTRFQKDNESVLKTMIMSYVGFIDAHEIFMSWKNNYSYFEKIINNALSTEQMKCFKDFVNSIEGNWISLSLTTPKEAIVNMPIEQILTIQTDNIDLGMDIYISWKADSNYDIQLLSPLPMVDSHKKGYFLHISGKKNLKLLFRSHCCGKINLGEVVIYSVNNQFIAKAPLNTINIREGFSFYYYYKPNLKIYQVLKGIIAQTDNNEFFPITILGEGGIGKSSLISEVYAYAVQREYKTFDIAQPKDQQHNRFIIKKLFRAIISAEDEEYFYDYNIITYIRKFLGRNFVEDWSDNLNNYFVDENAEINATFIADCLVLCFIKMASKDNVLLWFSDLQWASSETIKILETFVNELHNKNNFFKKKVIVIFEGRKNEYILINNKEIYPTHWNEFTNNNILKKYELKSWDEKDSYEFLKVLFGLDSSDEFIYENYINKLLSKSKGNPMFMLESVRYLLEKNKLAFNEEHKIVILNNDLTDIYVKDICEIVTRRITYYQQNYKNYIDILIIIAKLNGIQPILYKQLIDEFCYEYENLEELEIDSGFGCHKNGKYFFSHENYLIAFRKLKISNKLILQKAIDFYSQLQDNNSQLFTIILKKNLSNYNMYKLRNEIILLLKNTNNIYIKNDLYIILLDMPELPDKNKDIPRIKVLFELAELNVQNGNWENGLSYLNDLCEELNECEYDNILYKLKAKQEISNILADMLLFDKSIKEANEGIAIAELHIESNEFSTEQIYSLKSECQKLYARLAVCYWFSGDLYRACKLQKKAYLDAKKIKNDYMCARVLYEMGTLQFHCDINWGLKTFSKSRYIGASCLQLKDEKTLIDVQELIGKLLKAVKENDFNEIEQIDKKIKLLLNSYKTSPRIYEEFLCYTMQGICFIEKNDYPSALNSFLYSLKSANESHMTNLEWKALFNIMQLNLIRKNQSSAFFYAEKANSILVNAIKENPTCKITLENMLKPVLNRLNKFLYEKDYIDCDESKMLSVKYDNYLFIIMN